MTPVLPAEKLRQADAHPIAHEPIASINLMERAAVACANMLMETLAYDVPVVVLAGMGNNGGDGLAIARILPMACLFYTSPSPPEPNRSPFAAFCFKQKKKQLAANN